MRSTEQTFGFSLIEVLMVLFILGLMFSTFVSMRGFQQRARLDLDAAFMSAGISEALSAVRTRNLDATLQVSGNVVRVRQDGKVRFERRFVNTPSLSCAMVCPTSGFTLQAPMGRLSSDFDVTFARDGRRVVVGARGPAAMVLVRSTR